MARGWQLERSANSFGLQSCTATQPLQLAFGHADQQGFMELFQSLVNEVSVHSSHSSSGWLGLYAETARTVELQMQQRVNKRRLGLAECCITA